jgi:hypothetical protein
LHMFAMTTHVFPSFLVFYKCFRCMLQVFQLFWIYVTSVLNVAKVDWVLHILQCVWEVERGGTSRPYAWSGGASLAWAHEMQAQPGRAGPNIGNGVQRRHPRRSGASAALQEKRRTNPFYLHAGATHTEWVQTVWTQTRCKWFDHLIIHRIDLHRWCLLLIILDIEKSEKVDSVASIVWTTVTDYEAV